MCLPKIFEYVILNLSYYHSQHMLFDTLLTIFFLSILHFFCVYRIHLLHKELSSLPSRQEYEVLVADFGIILQKELQKHAEEQRLLTHAWIKSATEEIKLKIDENRRNKKIEDEDKWDAYRRAFQNPIPLSDALRGGR